MRRVGRRALSAVALSACCPCPAIASPRPPLRVALYPNIANAAPLFAYRNGLFASAGVRVEFETVEWSAPPARLVAADFDILAAAHLFAAAPLTEPQAQQARIVAFHGYSEKYFVEGLVARPESAIHSISDLRGKRLAIFDGVANTAVTSWLAERVGLAPRDLADIVVGPHERMPEMLRQGRVDAAFCLEPWCTHLQDTHGFPIVETALLSRYFTGDPESLTFPRCVLVSRAARVRNSEALSAAMAAWNIAALIVAEDTDARVEAVRLLFPGFEVSRSVGMARTILVRDLTAVHISQIQNTLTFAARRGWLPRNVDFFEATLAL